MYKAFVGELNTSLELYDRAAEEADGTDDFAFRIEMLGRRGYAHLLTGDLEKALALALETQELAGGERRDERVPVGDWIFFRGFTVLPLTYLGRLDEATEVIDTSLRWHSKPVKHRRSPLCAASRSPWLGSVATRRPLWDTRVPN